MVPWMLLAFLGTQDPGIEKLAEKLGDPDAAVREEATRRLEEAGAKALECLRKAAQSADPEVSSRACGLLARLDRKEKVLGIIPPARLVTLSMEDGTLDDAVRKISEQTGYPARIRSPFDPVGVNSLKLEKVPFWESILEVSRRLPRGRYGSIPLTWSVDGELVLSPAQPLPSRVDGPMLLQIHTAHESALDFFLFMEPSHRATRIAARAEMVELADGEGRPIPLKNAVQWTGTGRSGPSFPDIGPLPPVLSRVRLKLTSFHYVEKCPLKLAPAREVRQLEARGFRFRYHVEPFRTWSRVVVVAQPLDPTKEHLLGHSRVGPLAPLVRGFDASGKALPAFDTDVGGTPVVEGEFAFAKGFGDLGRDDPLRPEEVASVEVVLITDSVSRVYDFTFEDVKVKIPSKPR